MKTISVCFVAAVLAAVPGARVASAETKQVNSHADDLPIELLARLCDRGMVALVETLGDGRSRQVVLFARLPAEPQRVYDVLMDVQSYPKFLNTVDDVRILGRRQGLTAFSWNLDLPLMALRGTRLQRGLPARIIESRGRTGHLRGTRERWEFYPVEGGTLVAFYRALDTETGGFLLRTLVELEPSIDAGANLSSGFIHLRGLERHLAGLPAVTTMPEGRTGPVPSFKPLGVGNDVSLDALRPLLTHGLLAVIESHDDGSLRQVALLGLAKTSAEQFQKVVATPSLYPEFMPNISEQKVTPLDDGRLQLEWTIETPVTSMSGTALMQVETSTVQITAVSGDVARARLLWRFMPVADDQSVAVYYTYSDIRSASWVTRMMLNAEPLLEHGMVAAAATVALTAMTARAEGRR